MLRNILFCLVALSIAGSTQAMTEEEIKIVKESVLELCRGGSLQGKTSSVSVKGDGAVTIVIFKKLVEAGLNGKAEFSEKEWIGIQPLLPEKFDSKAYTECVKELTPKFLDKFSSASIYLKSVNITGKWLYPDKKHYWVVRPAGASGGFKIELYAIDLFSNKYNSLVGEGTATVSGKTVNFSLRYRDHSTSFNKYKNGDINGQLEYKDNQLSGQTDRPNQMDWPNQDQSGIGTITLLRDE